MAKNLAAKLPAGDSLVIYDVNKTSTTSFTKEWATSDNDNGVKIHVSENTVEVAEKSVSFPQYSSTCMREREREKKKKEKKLQMMNNTFHPHNMI